MAKQTILTERGTGEVMYPRTLASLVRSAGGGNVDEELGKARFALFIDMWNTKCINPEYGRYDPDNAPDAEHPFYLNELWLTYKEALKVDMYSTTAVLAEARPATNYGMGAQYCRTLYPMNTVPIFSLYHLTRFSLIETVRIIPYYKNHAHCSDLRGAFSGSRVRKVFGTFYFPQVDNPNYTIYDWTNRSLEEFSGAMLKCSISVSGCPKLNLHTFQFMVNNASNTSPITIEVHPDVYAKLTSDTTNVAAAALAPEELAKWQQVLTDAAAKNISFATT